MQVTTDSGAEILSFSKAAMEVTTDLEPPAAPVEKSRQTSASACELYRETIQLGLSQGRNAMGIWQDLVDSCGFRDGYQSVKRFVRKLRGMQSPEPRVVIETAPGEELQVDYGSGPMVRDPQSGKYRRTRMFVLTLGYSRKSVRLLCFRSSTRTRAELHEQAFRRLGGSTRIVVLDNLREGVLVPDLYDPSLNPLYHDVLAHYGVVALPCRIRDPDRKGKVESGVGHAKKTPLKGKRFESLEEAQAYLDHWEERWADTRIHGTTKRQVAAMFASGDCVPGGVIADAFHAKGHHHPEHLLSIVAELIQTTAAREVAHHRNSAPVWIPRNGKDSKGVPFIVLTCAECLRSFPLSVLQEDLQEIQDTPCIFCLNPVRYVIDFSLAVASPKAVTGESG